MPTLKVEIPTVTEGETGTVKLTLSQAPSQSIEITSADAALVCGNPIACPQGTASASSSDYSFSTAVITFAIGETEKTVSFTATEDSTSESTEVFLFTVTGLSASEATIDPSTPADGQGFGQPFWIVRIQDNDNPANPNVTIAPGTSPVTEGTAATFTVTATPAPTAATTVSVAVTEETSGGQDFVALSNETTHTVSIPASGSPGAGTGTLTIPTAGDATQEPHGAVTATVSSGTGYTVGNPSSATVTVLDDDGTPLPPEISVSLPSAEGVSPVDGKKPRGESVGSAVFNLSANQVLTSTLTVCVRVTESGGDRVTSGNEGIKTVSLTSSGNTNGTGTHTLTWTNTAADDPDSSVTVEVLAPNTASCSAGSYTVSSGDGSDTILIQDDEDTTVSLTSTDMTMTEGDATDTATLTVSLSRRLYGGETIGVPIALATTTGARLPGSTDSGNVANHDFTVSAAAASMHSGVTLANALTANPRVVFTGHDTNTVQTATVTLTPVANRDDPDATHETITATFTSLGQVDTTVNGGVTAHSSDNAATLSLEDDEAVPPATTCPAQNGIFSETRLRILETGETTYCVRLTRPPSGGDTTVTIGTTGSYTGAATASPTTLTFTASNYQTPQQVTVTGVDQTSLHLNRTLSLTHTANGGNYTNWSLGTVRVEVDDAPELEAWDTAVWQYTVLDEGDLDNPDPSKRRARTIRVDSDPVQRPSTVKATRGFRFFRQDFAPGPSGLWYRLRLSNRPEPGGTVTVTAMSSDFTRFGLALTSYGTPRQSLTVTFTESGELDRRIWVFNRQALPAPSKGCADITHTASGGGLRPGRIGTIRAHTVSNNGSSCPRITGTPAAGDSRSAPALAAPTPTEAVANLQVTAVDDTSASVTWDAVEHATSYDVSWSAESGDALNASAGDLPGVTGTTATIQHDAPAAMTLTVTVTPEYVDKNGDTQQLASLAGTATLAVGPGSDALSASAQSTDSQTAACVSDALLADARKAATETWRTSPGHVERWSRVLAAFGESNAWSSNPMTVAEAQAQADRGLQRWAPVAPALECLEKEPAEAEAQADAQQAVPAITVTAGAGVTEGAAAGFTLKADPVPAEELAVTVAIAETGAIADASAIGERIVTIPAGQAEAAFTVATLADETDEPAGAVTATVSDGAGYTVDDQGKSASVAVADDDATALVLTAPAGDLPEASGSKTLTLTLGRALVEGESLAVPLAFAGTATLGTDYTLAAPETAAAGVTYANLAGTDPKRPPTVTFAGAAGRKSATVATLVLATVADSVAEGERETVTVKPGTPVATGLGGGAAASGAAGFAILEPPPEIAIAAKTGTVTEGADASFTLTASRAPGADLTVRLTVSEADGSDFVAAEHEGTATATIAKGETETAFTVPTVNDTADEPDGAVTAALAGDGGKGLLYTVAAAPDNAASVKVTDDDAAATAPTFSVGDETANEDVGMMYFTVRLDRAVKQAVKVTVTAREASPVSARHGEDWQWWWPDGIALTFHPGQTEKKMPVYVYNDNHDEDPETFEVALSNPTGGTAIGDGVAVGTIVNDDPMPAAWLARFGRTAAEQALDGIAGRIAAPRTAGVRGAIAGQALNLDPGSTGSQSGGGSDGPGGSTNGNAVSGAPSGNDLLAPSGVARAFGAGNGHFGTGGTGHDAHGFGFGSSEPQAYSLTAREALLGSSFTATGEKDGTGGSLAFWGRAAQSSFDGREGTFSLDGEATAAMLGADYARGNWLLGMALMQSSGEGGYRDTDPGGNVCADLDMDGAVPPPDLCNGAVQDGDGEVEASLTAAVPYAAIQASERLKLWGALGYGTGEVTLRPDLGGRSLTADISWTMAAAGLRGDVIAPPAEGSGPALAVTSDALWARTSSDKTHELAASDSDVTRLRLGLEGGYRIATEGGGHVTPKLEIGMRHDGGDAETGFGLELGGGLAWVDPGLGLSLDVSGRTLIAHGNDDLEDRGFAASFAFDPDPATKRGPSLTLTQDWGGQAKGGLDALFTPQTLDRRGGGGEATARWRAEAAYGFPAFSGRFTGSPHVGLGLATGARDYSVGWRLTPAANANAPDLSFGVRATRRESDWTEPEHTVGFEAVARW